MQELIEYTKEMKDKNMFSFSNFFEEAEQLISLERQQIIDAFKRGLINEMNGIEELNSEQYYSETFNNKD